MEELFGKLSLEAAESTSAEVNDLIEEINRVIRPPLPISADQVHLGALYAASNQVNLQGGCFAPEELTELAGLVVDTPVMVGHKKQELPIGRVFKGEIVERNGAPWLKAYFYWRRDQEDADSLRANIESGVYRECSLAFLYSRPECSVCRDDMRTCRHRVGAIAGRGQSEHKAFFYYKDISKVLEISLVYRGAVEGTTVTTLCDESAHQRDAESHDPFWRCQARPLVSMEQVDSSLDQVMIEPLYNGLWLDVACEDGKVSATTLSGESYHHPLLNELGELMQVSRFRTVCQICPMKGSTRLPLSALTGNPERHAKLFLFDLLQVDQEDVSGVPVVERKKRLSPSFTRNERIVTAPYYVGRFVDLHRVAESKGNDLGFLMTDLGSGAQTGCFEFRRKHLVRGKVVADTESGQYSIQFGNSDELHQLLISRDRVAAGSTIWAKPRAGAGKRFEFVDLCQDGIAPDESNLVETISRESCPSEYHLFVDGYGDMWLDLYPVAGEKLLKISKLSEPLLRNGRRFWCEFVDIGLNRNVSVGPVRLIDCGPFRITHEESRQRMKLELKGHLLEGTYLVEFVQMNAKSGFLFSQSREGHATAISTAERDISLQEVS